MPAAPKFLAHPAAHGVIHVSSDSALADAFILGGVSFATAAAWPAANRAIYVPFQVQRPCVAVKGYWMNGATISGNVDIGIYDIAQARLGSAGSTAQSGASVPQIVDITDIPLPPGWYWMAMAVDNTTGTFERTTGINAQYEQAQGVQQQATAFPLPSSATFANPGSAYVPNFGFSLKTVI